MIFTLVSSAQEWLNVKWDELKKLRDEENMKQQKELEEAERVTKSCPNFKYLQIICCRKSLRVQE